MYSLLVQRVSYCCSYFQKPVQVSARKNLLKLRVIFFNSTLNKFIFNHLLTLKLQKKNNNNNTDFLFGDCFINQTLGVFIVCSFCAWVFWGLQRFWLVLVRLRRNCGRQLVNGWRVTPPPGQYLAVLMRRTVRCKVHKDPVCDLIKILLLLLLLLLFALWIIKSGSENTVCSVLSQIFDMMLEEKVFFLHLFLEKTTNNWEEIELSKSTKKCYYLEVV